MENIELEKIVESRATSGSFYSSFGTNSAYRLVVEWSRNSVDIANNKSNVTVKASLQSTGSSYSISSSATKNGTLTINGTAYSFTFTAGLSGGQKKQIYSKTVDIYHNSDGTKSFSMACSATIGITFSSGKVNTVTTSGTGTLDNIPRTSSFTLSTSSLDAGNTITINISRASSSFTHKVFYSFGSHSATISTNATTSASYAIPISHLSAIPNATSGTATISVDTYNGSTYIGSTSKNFTITAPSSVKPTISSITATIVASGADTSYGYVKGKSKCKLVINGATGSYGSTIKSYNISGGGFSSSAQTFTTEALTSSGNITFTANVTDSRGRKSDNKTVTINVLDYTNPNIVGYNVIRCNSDGTANEDGKYLKIWAQYTYSTLGNKNTITSKAEYKKTSVTTWTNAGAINSNSYIVTGNNTIATDASFDVKFTITDKFTSVSKTMVIPTSFVTLDIKKGGKGIAFGKTAETDNLLDIGMNARLGGTTTLAGDVKLSSPNGTWSGEFIKRYEGDQYGMGVAIQTGGKIAIGAGESAITFMNGDGNYGAENSYLTADSNVYLISNLNNGYGDRKHLCFNNAGQLSFSDGSCHIQFPSNGGSWLNGATNGNIRGSKQSTGSYHPIISQTTSSNHKISLGGLGDDFGFYLYDASRTVNGIDGYFKFLLNNKEIETDRVLNMGNSIKFWNNNSLQFATHGGGWFMQDSTWVRSYNSKSLYTGGGTIKTEGTIVCKILDDVVGSANSCYVDNANGANSQITLRPDADNRGNLGHKNYTWNYANITAIGNTYSIDRESTYNVSKFDNNDMMYDMVKNMNFYLEKEKSIEEFEEEVKLKQTEEYQNADEETQNQMLRKLEKTTPASYYYSKRTRLVANADELPFEVAPESHVSDGSRTIETGAFMAGLASALQKAIGKIEMLENKVEELEYQLENIESN